MRPLSTRPTVRALPALVLTALALAACGGPASTSAGGAEDVLPLTVHVTGGLRGLDDTVVVAAGGATTGSVGDADVSCTLTPQALAALVAAAADELRPGSPATTPPGGDLIVTTVSGPGGVAVGTEADQTSRAARLGAALVADVALPARQRSLCR